MAGRIKKMLTLIKNKRGLFVIEKFNDESGVFASCDSLTERKHNFNAHRRKATQTVNNWQDVVHFSQSPIHINGSQSPDNHTPQAHHAEKYKPILATFIALILAVAISLHSKLNAHSLKVF